MSERAKELREFIKSIRIERRKLLNEQREYRIELQELRSLKEAEK